MYIASMSWSPGPPMSESRASLILPIDRAHWTNHRQNRASGSRSLYLTASGETISRSMSSRRLEILDLLIYCARQFESLPSRTGAICPPIDFGGAASVLPYDLTHKVVLSSANPMVLKGLCGP